MKTAEPSPNGQLPSTNIEGLSVSAAKVLEDVLAVRRQLAAEGGEITDIVVICRGRMADGVEFPFYKRDVARGGLVSSALISWASQASSEGIARHVRLLATSPEAGKTAQPASDQSETASPSGQG